MTAGSAGQVGGVLVVAATSLFHGFDIGLCPYPDCGHQWKERTPQAVASLGSGANNAARYLGSSVGATVVAIVATGKGTHPHATAAGWNHALLVAAAVAVLTALALLALSRRAER